MVSLFYAEQLILQNFSTEMETAVTRGCRSLQGYTEEFVCRIQASYFRTEVTDVLTWFAVARFAELLITDVELAGLGAGGRGLQRPAPPPAATPALPPPFT